MAQTKKIVVIGGTGLIGSQLVQKLRDQGHEVVAASRSTGINAVTGEGLADALTGASIVVDVSNSPTFEDKAVLEFFETSTRNALDAGANAGVQHYVALSVVGTERLLDSGYFRAKIAQEKLIEASNLPYTIVRATQFFEFVDFIAQYGAVGDTVHATPARIQPISSQDVVDGLVDVVLAEPVNGAIELAGPEKYLMNELIGKYLSAKGDTREVVADPAASYFGVVLQDYSLTANDDARLGATRFEDWTRQFQV